VRIVVVEMLDTLLAPYGERLRRYTREALEARGVEVRLGVGIERAAADHVVLTDGGRIDTRTLIWSAGVTANPLAAALGVPTGRGGRIAVDGALRVPEEPGWWVVGDLAAATDEHGDLLPQLAPVAIQQGRHVAESIVAVLSGHDPAPFRYVDKGTMATIGRHDAVVQLPGSIRFRGVVAWVAWLFLHLMYLVGFRNRVWVFLSWAWNYVTWDRAARVVLDPGNGPDGAPSGDGAGRGSGPAGGEGDRV
jgi:NADH:ubiquinone reductase (H+-translocating)